MVVGGVVVADAGARLHRGGSDAVDHEVMLDDVIGFLKGGVDGRFVAYAHLEDDVVFAIVPNQRRAGLGGLRGIGDGGQGLVFHFDQLSGIRRLMVGLRNDKGDVVANPAHAVLHEARVGRLVHRSAVFPLALVRARHVAKSRCFPIRAGQHRQHARRCLGCAGVDGENFRMRMRRAQHEAVGHARQCHVRHVAAAAAHEPRILKTRHRLTERKLTHFDLFPGKQPWWGYAANCAALATVSFRRTGAEGKPGRNRALGGIRRARVPISPPLAARNRSARRRRRRA